MAHYEEWSQEVEEALNYEMEVLDEGTPSGQEAEVPPPSSDESSRDGVATEVVDEAGGDRQKDDLEEMMIARLLSGDRMTKVIQAAVRAEAAATEAAAALRTGAQARARLRARLRTPAERGVAPRGRGVSKSRGRPRGGCHARSVPGSCQGECRGECCSRGRSQASTSSRDGPVGSRAGGDILEPFDPDDEDPNVDSWLNKLDQLGKVHVWSEYERSCFMQAKLRGAAKKWFLRLDEYDHSWSRWKECLRHAFPRQHDYAAMVEELVARRKLPGETMTAYFHAKLAMSERCGMKGERAISFIIGGLPLELQANARAFKCSNPQDLYSWLLAGMEDHYQEAGPSYSQLDERKRRRPDQGSHVSRRRPRYSGQSGGNGGNSGGNRGDDPPQMKRCYNCQEFGTHISRDCPKPRENRCRRCGQEGHVKTRCPRRPAEAVASRMKARKVRPVNPDHGDAYKKVALLENGERICAFLDTGSEYKIVTRQCIGRIPRCKVRHIVATLQGFGGGRVSGVAEASFTVSVEGVALAIMAVVVDYDLSGVDLLVGQPALSGNVVLEVRGGEVLCRPGILLLQIVLIIINCFSYIFCSLIDVSFSSQ